MKGEFSHHGLSGSESIAAIHSARLDNPTSGCPSGRNEIFPVWEMSKWSHLVAAENTCFSFWVLIFNRSAEENTYKLPLLRWERRAAKNSWTILEVVGGCPVTGSMCPANYPGASSVALPALLIGKSFEILFYFVDSLQETYRWKETQ